MKQTLGSFTLVLIALALAATLCATPLAMVWFANNGPDWITETHRMTNGVDRITALPALVITGFLAGVMTLCALVFTVGQLLGEEE